jgi:hypothetical protein
VQQIKIFKGVEHELANMERDINAWLKSSKAKVTQVFGNIAPQTLQSIGTQPQLLGAERGAAKSFGASDILVVMVYEAA